MLERGRVAETWRSRRWDSFCLVTPNWSIKLPGAEYRGPDPDGYLPLADLIAHLESWAASFDAPLRENCPVSRFEAAPGGKAIKPAIAAALIFSNLANLRSSKQRMRREEVLSCVSRTEQTVAS